MNKKDRRNYILGLIIAERDRQDKLWGGIEDRHRSVSKDRWMTILAEEVGEVARTIQDCNDDERMIELAQVAAVAFVTMEAILLKKVTTKLL